jgi:hypothetical protein
VSVFGNVIRIVDVQERIAHGGAVRDQRGDGEAEAGEKDKVRGFSIHWAGGL